MPQLFGALLVILVRTLCLSRAAGPGYASTESAEMDRIGGLPLSIVGRLDLHRTFITACQSMPIES